jgi:hypothetical protein
MNNLWFRVEDLGEDMFIMCKINKHEVAPTTNLLSQHTIRCYQDTKSKWNG